MDHTPETKIHPVTHLVSHRHFIRGLHLTAMSIAIWAVAMSWITAVTFPGSAQAEIGTTVSGRILVAGAPVPVGKVQVQFMQNNQPPQVMPSATDSGGNFIFTNVTPGSGYMVQVQIIDTTFPYLGKFVQNLTVASGANNVGDIALSSAAKTLTVTVTRSSTGAGVGSVNVNAFKMGGEPGMNPNATTDSNGVAVLRMGGGTWGINIQSGWGPNGQQLVADWVFIGQQSQVAFAADESAESQNLGISVQTATATVMGQIKYPDGTAGSRLGLNLRGGENAMIQGNTDEAGNFQIKLVAGSYEFGCFLPPEKSQYSCPSSAFSIADGATKDFGIITLGQKTARITGQVLCAGVPMANANINAYPTQQAGGGGNFNQQASSGADGTYTLYINSGTWGLNINTQPGTGCVAANGPSTEVTVSENQTVSGINFNLIRADVTINGTVKDTNGATVTNFFGYANAMDATNDNFGPGKQFGGPVQGGTFQIMLPSSAMTKATIGVFPPPQGAQYSVKSPVTLDIAANQTYAVTVVVGLNDAALSGQVKDSRGNLIASAEGEVFMSNETNTQFMNARIQGGSYSFSVLGGTKWRLGYRVRGNFQDQPSSNDLISIAAGQTVTKDIVVTATDATIQVTLKDPDGNLVPFGFANAHQPFNQSLSTKEPPRGGGGEVRNGVATINIVGGFTYNVGAGLPPEYGDKNYMPPEEQTVKPAANGSASVTLSFRRADGSLKGAAKLSTGGNASFGFVGCWSDKGSHSGGQVFNGSYSVSLTKSDTWHCHGNSFNGTEFYDTGDFSVTTDATTGFTVSKDITLTKSTFVMPQPVTESVDATQQKIVTLSDGTTITIPSGAFGTSGTFTLTATPTVNLTPSANSKPALGFGYTLGVTNSSGTAVTTFNSSVAISFPYDAASLTKRGLQATDLVPKYYDSTSNTWQDVDSVTVNTAASMITFTTTHFTDFALVTGQSGTITLAKVTTSTKNGLTSFTVNNKKVTPFTCKGSVKVATKAVNGAQYVAAVTTCDGKLKIYDASGVLKKTITSGWKGINHVVFADVNKDSQPDVVIAPISGKDVKIVNLASNYKVASIGLGSTGKWTAAYVDFNGKGTSGLAIARVNGSTASNFRVFGYGKGKYSESSTPYKGFLKNSGGNIVYSLPAPSLTRLSTSTVGKSKTKVAITLTGTSFTPDMTVTINNVSVKVTYKSKTSAVITVNGTKIKAGSYTLKLTNPGNKSATSKLKVTVK